MVAKPGEIIWLKPSEINQLARNAMHVSRRYDSRVWRAKLALRGTLAKTKKKKPVRK